MSNRLIDYLLIGGGRTSANAAEAIRAKDSDGSILIVAGEDRKPYDRPPLSKNFLEGRPPNPDDVESKPDDFFDKHRVELLRGVIVDSIDRDLKLVSLSDGGSLEYRKLLLATGATPIKLPLPGSDRDNVYYLRTVDDSMRIRDAAKTAKSAVLIGSGFIGTEVSASLTGLGVRCTMIGREAWPWGRILSETTGPWFARYFENKGVSVKNNSAVAAINDRGVLLGSGEEIPGEIVVVGIGVRLNLGLARDAGLGVTPEGVYTDASLRTGDRDIWAAGDIAFYEDLNFGKRWHLEHYMNADWQGTHVGTNMATNADTPFRQVPYFFSDLFDLHFVLRGDPYGGESAKLIGDLEGAEFVELFAYADGRLAKGLVFTRDADKQDQLGDKIEKYVLEKRQVAGLDESSF